MSEIIEKTYALIDTLEASDLIKYLVFYRDKLLNNKDILKEIKEIQNESNNEIIIDKKKKLYLNNDYQMYMKYYNELSLIVLRINKKYKEYTSTKEHNCHG